MHRRGVVPQQNIVLIVLMLGDEAILERVCTEIVQQLLSLIVQERL